MASHVLSYLHLRSVLHFLESRTVGHFTYQRLRLQKHEFLVSRESCVALCSRCQRFTESSFLKHNQLQMIMLKPVYVYCVQIMVPMTPLVPPTPKKRSTYFLLLCY